MMSPEHHKTGPRYNQEYSKNTPGYQQDFTKTSHTKTSPIEYKNDTKEKYQDITQTPPRIHQDVTKPRRHQGSTQASPRRPILTLPAGTLQALHQAPAALSLDLAAQLGTRRTACHPRSFPYVTTQRRSSMFLSLTPRPLLPPTPGSPFPPAVPLALLPRLHPPRILSRNKHPTTSSTETHEHDGFANKTLTHGLPFPLPALFIHPVSRHELNTSPPHPGRPISLISM